MKSLRSVATAQLDPPPQTSVKALAGTVNLRVPVSVKALIAALSAPVSFHGDIRTPAGTALGGTADITLFSDGGYEFKVDMHDSGADPYRFRVRCTVQAPSGLIFLFQTSGHTDGTGSNLLGHINRDFHHDEHNQDTEQDRNQKSLIQKNWTDVRQSSMSVSKSYDDVGALSTLEDIAKDLLGFLIADVTLGAGLALVVCVSADVADALNASFVGTGGLVGVVVAGGVVWVFGPSAIIAAVVAGVAAGAITDALIRHRQMTTEEYDFATIVFGNTLPPRERIFLTNLSHDGRKYTWPNVDGSVLVNLDNAFDAPMKFADNSYPTQGQVFIHELTHAWQIQTKRFVPGMICKRITTTNAYDTVPAGLPWSGFGMEEQALIVDKWFNTYAKDWTDPENLKAKLAAQAAIQDPYFAYIANNIRFGQN